MGELHVFIIWEKARHKQAEIIADLERNLTVLEVYELTWSASHFSRNLSRFYGEKLPPRSGKERHCGSGPFVLLIVMDKAPRYEFRQTSKGVHRVNTLMFDLKEKYRTWTGGGHKIHATNSVEESGHDLALLLGMKAAQFKVENPVPWQQHVAPLCQDLVGAESWSSLQEFFYVLNQTSSYVVLRNFECLPGEYHIEGHGDIDLLTDDYHQMCYVTNARRAYLAPFRVHNFVKIGDTEVPFDFRFVGDSYLDSAWQSDMLARRVYLDNGFYIPSLEDHFYSLLYHAAVHKPTISVDYAERLAKLANSLDHTNLTPETFQDRSRVQSLIATFLDRCGYCFVEPKDLSVYYNILAVNAGKCTLRRTIWATTSHLIHQVRRFAKWIVMSFRRKLMAAADDHWTC